MHHTDKRMFLFLMFVGGVALAALQVIKSVIEREVQILGSSSKETCISYC